MSLLSIIYKVKSTTTWLIRGVVVFFIYIALKNFIPQHLVSSTSVAVIEPATGEDSVAASFARVAFEVAFEMANDEAGLFQGQIDVVEVGTTPSNESDAAAIRKALIENDVEAIFGCATSACVRLITPIAEELQIPFFYPYPHEGLVSSRYAFFLGPLPNQHLVPATLWALEKYGPRVHIAGANTVYSRVLGEIARDTVITAGGHITGEHYYGTDHGTISAVPEAWTTATTDFVINLADEETLINLMKLASVERAGLQRPPHILMNLDSALIEDVGRYSLVGHYIVSPYPQDFDTGPLGQFQQRWASKMGGARTPGASEVAAFMAVRLWSTALRNSPTRKPTGVIAALNDLRIDTGEAIGTVSFERNQHYLDHRQFILKILAGDEFKLVSSERKPIKPAIYPVSRSKQYWAELIEQLRQETSDTWVFEEQLIIGPTGNGA